MLSTDNPSEANRVSWNAATERHLQHRAGQAAFFRAGRHKLYPEELELLGDLRGNRVLHIQCNAGQDTLSLANLGADVTGVDISDVAVEAARRLSAEAGVPATFHRAEVVQWLRQHTGPAFDVAFASYGALCWIQDLRGWFVGAAGVLRPGGRLVVVDYHPFMAVLEDDWQLHNDYFGYGQMLTFDQGIGDYVGPSVDPLKPDAAPTAEAAAEAWVNPNPSFEWKHTLGEIVTAAAGAGLHVAQLREWPYANGFAFSPKMRRDGVRYHQPPDTPKVPLMFGLAACRP